MKVSIRPTTIHDKKKVFEWLAHSNLTNEMLGGPKFPDNPAPTWKEFDQDYLDYFFDGTRPEKGRCFIIICDGTEVGQINYNPIDKKTKTTELDIWLSDKKYTGQGIGTAAIKLLCSQLFENLGCKQIIIQPSARNENAIKAYKKAGFIVQNQVPKGFELDYHDSVIMILSNQNTMSFS